MGEGQSIYLNHEVETDMGALSSSQNFASLSEGISNRFDLAG